MKQAELFDACIASPANPFADPRPLLICDACGRGDFRDRVIHNGQSTIRECRRCSRFMGFPVWYGHVDPPMPPTAPENASRRGRATLP